MILFVFFQQLGIFLWVIPVLFGLENMFSVHARGRGRKGRKFLYFNVQKKVLFSYGLDPVSYNSTYPYDDDEKRYI